ncbi:MAG: response regulator [bacterium]|nr:response regulator [bacterium]
MSQILIVDDEPHLEILIQQKFRKEIKAGDYSFLFAQNGREALDIVNDTPSIHVVATDLNMPEMDGITLLKHVKEKHPHIHFIIISAYTDQDSIDTTQELGAGHFLTKPLNLTELGKLLTSFLPG